MNVRSTLNVDSNFGVTIYTYHLHVKFLSCFFLTKTSMLQFMLVDLLFFNSFNIVILPLNLDCMLIGKIPEPKSWTNANEFVGIFVSQTHIHHYNCNILSSLQSSVFQSRLVSVFYFYFSFHLFVSLRSGREMMLGTALSPRAATPMATRIGGPSSKCCTQRRFRVSADSFPSFLPKEIHKIKDSFARKLAARIERLPVELSSSNSPILSSCVKPIIHGETNPVVLLHGFDSSCLEWRCTLPLLEDARLETWAVDILGWGFSDLESLPACNVISKRDHLYQFWKSYIKRPMILVGPSLGAAVAIDFVVNHPEAVDKLVLIDASVYAEGTGNLSKLPKAVAYAGVYLLKSIPLRFYATSLTFNGIPLNKCLDWTNIGRLHCLLPWWEDTTVDFMNSGGYNVTAQINQVKQETLIIWGEDDQIIDNKLAVRLHCELSNAIIRQIPNCGHIPHVEKPNAVAKLIMEFVKADCAARVLTTV